MALYLRNTIRYLRRSKSLWWKHVWFSNVSTGGHHHLVLQLLWTCTGLALDVLVNIFPKSYWIRFMYMAMTFFVCLCFVLDMLFSDVHHKNYAQSSFRITFLELGDHTIYLRQWLNTAQYVNTSHVSSNIIITTSKQSNTFPPVYIFCNNIFKVPMKISIQIARNYFNITDPLWGRTTSDQTILLQNVW